MNNLIIGLIIAVIALPFYFGLKKIAAMFGVKIPVVAASQTVVVGAHQRA